MTANFKILEQLAEKYRLEAESYFYQLEAKKNISDALVVLSGIIIKMHADLSAYESKHGKTAITEKRRELINDLEQISDVFYPLWMQMDNARTLAHQFAREKNELSIQLGIAKKELEIVKKAFEEL